MRLEELDLQTLLLPHYFWFEALKRHFTHFSLLATNEGPVVGYLDLEGEPTDQIDEAAAAVCAWISSDGQKTGLALYARDGRFAQVWEDLWDSRREDHSFPMIASMGKRMKALFE